MLNSFRDKLEVADIEASHYDKKSLLESSSSDEEELQNMNGLRKRQAHKVSLLTEDRQSSTSSEDEESKGITISLVEEEKRAAIDSHEEYLRQRGEKINRVQTSLAKIHKMYETLNEIV